MLLLLTLLLLLLWWLLWHVPRGQEGPLLQVHQSSVVQLPDGQAGHGLVHLQRQQRQLTHVEAISGGMTSGKC
jgi:hypothetical protein